MIRRAFLSSAVGFSAVCAGCFIETGPGGRIRHDGSIEIAEGTFSMTGEIVVTGDFEKSVYEDISILFYTPREEMLHTESVESLGRDIQRRSISIELRTIPEYIIFDSPDFWDGDLSVAYYTRSEQAANGYQFHDTDDRDDLPVAPDQ